MEAVTSDPILVEKIFDHLPMTDVYECRLVNKVWYEEAIRQLNKFPLDSCHVYVEDNQENYWKIRYGIYPEEVYQEWLESDLYKSIWRLHSDKMITPNSVKFPKNVIWNIKRGTSNVRTTEVVKRFGIFLNDGAKCFPSIPFISQNFFTALDKHTELIPINHPVVKIARLCMKDYRDIDPSMACHIPKSSSGTRKPLKACIEAIHINRYASDHKITLTDWSDPNPVKPDLHDPKFPVKSIIFIEHKSHDFVEGFDDYHEYCQFVEQFQIKISKGKSSQDIKWKPSLKSQNRNSHSMDNVGEEWKTTPALSIAFAGENVMSACCDFYMKVTGPWACYGCLEEPIDFGKVDNEELLDFQLDEFKRGLNFPVDDGRVFGFFFFEIDRYDSDPYSWWIFYRLSRIVEKKFPQIDFIRASWTIDKRIRNVNLTLHLIRI